MTNGRNAELPTVMVGGPVQNKVWAIDYYLDALLAQDYPKELTSLVWLVNDSKDGTKERLIKRIKPIKESSEYRRVMIVEINYGYDDVRRKRDNAEFRIYRTADPSRDVTNFAHFARMRNDWLKLRTHKLILKGRKVVEGDDISPSVGHEDLYFSVDSDVVIQNANVLSTLVRHRVDVVAIPVDNAENRSDKYDPREETIDKLIVDSTSKNADFLHKIKSGAIKGVAVGSPHVWNFGMIKGGYLSRFEPIPELFQVDATGACILFKKEIVEDGVYYGPHPGGEDFYFCALASSFGYKIYVDGSFRTVHMMDYNPFEEQLAKVVS